MYALYQFGLLTGHYRRLTPSIKILPLDPGRPDVYDHKGEETPFHIPASPSFPYQTLFQLFPVSLSEQDGLIALANEICTGQVRLFGGPAVPLNLENDLPKAHWTDYERGYIHLPPEVDIKFLWEPARFNWVFPLGRAYILTRQEAYAQFFWQSFETFSQANPPYDGIHWMSGQEVAIRLLSLIYARSVFEGSHHTTPQRKEFLQKTLAAHALRIPPTLVYARSQNNNHLISEAAVLYSAGIFLPDHPKAKQWLSLGWHWVNRALQTQIAKDGTYTQHSTNYHRLVLQLAIWLELLKNLPGGQTFPQATRQRLASATLWLEEQIQPQTGCVPNLGANDGANLMPLTPAPHSDFRPVVQVAAGLWVTPSPSTPGLPVKSGPPAYLLNSENDLRVFLRAVHFSSRPSHADQLHLDIWWQGINLARDAGTYQYNAPPPWDNSLATTAVHNTVMVDHQDQMTRAGKFLWLDWAQAWRIALEKDQDGKRSSLAARQNGYRHLGVIHQRTVTFTGAEEILVTDELIPSRPSAYGREITARLHWLLPDFPWSFSGETLLLTSPLGEISLSIRGVQAICLARAGEILSGTGEIQPATGWYSPTYGQKEPALAVIATVSGRLPVQFSSKWVFPVVKMSIP